MEKNLSKPLPIIHVAAAATDELNYIKGRKAGRIKSLKTSLTKFDSAGINGLEWGSIYTIAGMSGSGKTTFVNQLEEEFFKYNPREDFLTLNFNFEMKARRLIGRKFSQGLGKTVKQIYSADESPLDITDHEVSQAESIAKSLSTQPIFYVDTTGNVEEMRATIMKMHKLYPEKKILVTLDHTVLVKKLGTQTATDKLYELLAMFNECKKIITSSYIVLSQLNREIEATDRRTVPKLHYPIKQDLFGGDACYMFSDVVAVIHNPYRSFDILEYGTTKYPCRDKIFIHYLKCRDGQPFIAVMKDNLKHNKIEEETVI